MEFKQYTQCVEAKDHDTTDRRLQAGLVALSATLPPGLFILLLTIAHAGGPCLLFLIPFYGAVGLFAYCYWWLYRRLICLPAPPDHPGMGAGDHLAIGRLIDILDPANNSFPDIDSDYSIGILLTPNPLGTQYEFVSESSPYGYLVKEQPATHDHGVVFSGHKGTDHAFPGHPELEIQSEILHCEFEGAGVYDLLQATRVAVFLVAAALFVCILPGLGWLIALILVILGALLVGLGLVIATNDTGSPSDVNPSIGELHLNDEKHQGADVLVIMGHWVYDSGHNDSGGGWNEIHPIKFCTKTTDTTGDVILFRKRWETAIGQATSSVTLANQKLPQNQWQVHPIIDGCQPSVIV
jgi:hypothetical protein